MMPVLDMKLTSEQIRQFKQDGFLSIPQLMDAQTLEMLRREYDRFMDGEIECGKDKRLLGGLIPQVMNPSRHSAVMRNNPALRTAKGIATQLMDTPTKGRIRVFFDMLINKPAGTEEETPWHQDYAYFDMPMTAAGTPIPDLANMHFWVALDDVDLENGCMQFLPGMHTGRLMEHRVASGDPSYEGRLLAIDQIDSSKAVVHPLQAGGCTIHHYAAPHYTGPNNTPDRNRRAYIFNLVWDANDTLSSRILKRIKRKLAKLF